MKDHTLEAVTLGFVLYAVYMEGLKGLFKCWGLTVGFHLVLSGIDF